MFKTIIALSCFSMVALAGSAAMAEELPTPHQTGVCEIVADAVYTAAEETGADFPDAAYEAAMADCDWGGYSALTLNEQIAEDGQVWLPVCQFTGGCPSR